MARPPLIPFVIFLAVLAVDGPTGASAGTYLCSDVLSQPAEADIFSRLERFEAEAERLRVLAVQALATDSERQQELYEIISELTEKSFLESLERKAIEGYNVRPHEYDRVRTTLAEFENRISGGVTPSQPQPSLSLEGVLQDLTTVAAETVYSVLDPEGREVQFLFSNEIVKELFLAPFDKRSEFLLRSLRLIDRGIFGGGYEGVALKRTIERPDHVYIRIRGPNAAFRLMGYVHDNVIHFVYWTNESDHGSNSQRRFRTAIDSQRTSRGH